MKKIVAFAGSNSKQSINKKLVTYASSLIDGVEINLLDLNDFELPLFGVDYERENGFPDHAKKLLEHIKDSDGIMVSLAEHNGAYSTAFKNALDWLSRIEGKLFFGKPMFLMATSPGSRGGQSVLSIAKDRFPRHDAIIVEVFSLPFFDDNFSNGKINDETLDSELKEKIRVFKKTL